MVWDRLTKAGKKAAGKAKEYDQKMVERHGDDADALDQLTGDNDRNTADMGMDLGIDDGGNRAETDDILGLGGGMGGDMGGGRGRTLEVEYRGSTDDWAVMTDGGYPLSTYKSKDAAVSDAKSRIAGNGEYSEYTVSGKQSGGGGFDLF